MITEERNKPFRRNEYSCRYLESGSRTKINLMVDATNKCQLACTYCYYGKKGSRLMDVNKVFTASTKMAELFAGRLDEVKIHYIGGEPLLAWDRILDLNEMAKEHFEGLGIPFRWSMTSNLVALDERKADHMIREKAGIHCSIDGPADIHNCNRPFKGGKGSYAAVFKAIPLALKITPDDTARVTVRPEHAERMPEITHEILNQGFESIALFPATGGHWTKKNIDGWQNGISSAFDLIRRCHGDRKKLFTIISPSAQSTGKGKSFSYCGAGKGLWSIDVDGNIYMCHHMTNKRDLAIINAARASVTEIRSAIEFSEIAPQNDSIHEKCHGCEALDFCRGGCWTSNFFANKSSMIPHKEECLLRIATVNAIGEKMNLSDSGCNACTALLGSGGCSQDHCFCYDRNQI